VYLEILSFNDIKVGLRCIHQLRYTLKHRSNQYDGLPLTSFPLSSIDESPSDLSALHQIRQDEMAVELFRTIYHDSYSPILQGNETLGQVHNSTLQWFHTASVEEKQKKGILFPGILESNRFYTADLLIQETNGSWTLYLVKAGSKIKERYVQEADWIKRGFNIRGISIHLVRLLLPSKEFTQETDSNLGTFFDEMSLTHDVKHLRRSSSVLLTSLESKLTNTPSLIELDGKSKSTIQSVMCNYPSNCPICSQVLQDNGYSKSKSASQNKSDLPVKLDYSVFQLFRSGSLARKLQSEGINDIRDIHKAPTYLKRELKERHMIQAEAYRTGLPQIQKNQLYKWFQLLTFPLEFLDFESFSSALPPYINSQPWQPIPFAVSITRVANWNSPLINHVWVADPGTDGRNQLVDLLVESFGTHSGSILVYGKEFEVSILKLLQQQTQDNALKDELGRYISRIVDVQDIFSQFLYYHPEQGAKISLKNLVPLLTNGTQYFDLEIQDGAAASFGYFFHSFPDPKGRDKSLGLNEWNTFRQELEEYAALDTLGLAEIVINLHSILTQQS
jgi:hypothetical protein